MARPLRVEYTGVFYHVTSRGNERKKIFHAKSDYGKFKTYLKESREKYGYLLHSYVLMGNHYHLLIETPEGNLRRIMHYINGAYTNYSTGEEIVFRDIILGMISNNEKDAPGKYKEFVEKGMGQDQGNPLREVYGGLSMIALMEPPMIAVMEPFQNSQKAVLRVAKN